MDPGTACLAGLSFRKAATLPTSRLRCCRRRIRFFDRNVERGPSRQSRLSGGEIKKRLLRPALPARQGKLASRYNSLKHGLCATTVVLPGEDPERYDWRRQEYIDYIQPACLVETELADLICATQFRRERAVRYETALMLEARALYGPQLEGILPGHPEAVLDGLAFKRLADNSNSLQTLDRYEQRMTGIVLRAWKQLRELQKNRPPAGDDGPAVSAGPPAPHTPWPHPLPPRVQPPPPPVPNPPNEPIPKSEHRTANQEPCAQSASENPVRNPPNEPIPTTEQVLA